jgi:hypothetical protein
MGVGEKEGRRGVGGGQWRKRGTAEEKEGRDQVVSIEFP